MANYDNLLANVPTDLWIGGKWRKSSDNQRFDVIDPATENVITSVASATVDDAKAALDAWCQAAGITKGPIFLAIRKGGHVQSGAMTAQAIFNVVTAYARRSSRKSTTSF